ncbi:MAG: DEAD/DEAH box helicase [Lachnospiraceae bacterium]
MSNGAGSVHKKLRSELENYIKTQYFGKTPLLLDALEGRLDEEGLLYQKPYIESSPAYKSELNGLLKADIPEWLKQFFYKLSDAGLGVYPSPFVHQVQALEIAVKGRELFVATGTGSGKTECFMWPLMAKLVTEAREQRNTWNLRGVRTIIMYPMNALVSDQISRLRRLIGDPEEKFEKIFRETCGYETRRPQFGMYTGRTPYPGEQPVKKDDHELERTLSDMFYGQDEQKNEYLKKLQEEGKIPAKKDMKTFLEALHESKHIPDEEDAELLTRFEMQHVCPDILITNYSMLEYMLFRPREEKIWSDTEKWLHERKENKLLFVIDEAHMYKGSSGGEVALLIRRLFHKLHIDRSKVQFILTTASMPDREESDRRKVLSFARKLTAADENADFCYLTGEREDITGKAKYDIPFEKFLNCSTGDIEKGGEKQINELNAFWDGIEGAPLEPFETIKDAEFWMYENLIYFRPFYELMQQCRGKAVSLLELSKSIFPEESDEDAIYAVGVLLAIAPLARNNKGAILFPARMHMLFRGINGVYACTNENCKCSHTDGELTIGEIYLSDGHLTCPKCGSAVYELYNDRRCGAIFFKGYVLEDEIENSKHAFFWRYSGQILDQNMKEVHLYIPPAGYEAKNQKVKNPIKPCYLDTQSGFINFKDDSQAGKPGIRKLFYCNYSVKGRPSVITFPTCPHCRHRLSQMQLTSFSTKGNLAFYSLIQAQFQVQPAVQGKDKEKFPNEGRKVLLFSDSRQRAAKLALDMSEASDTEAVRQLFVLAIDEMEHSVIERSMDDLYDYFCLMAGEQNIQLLSGEDQKKFLDDCTKVVENYRRRKKRNKEYSPDMTFDNAPFKVKGYLLRLFCGGYNTLYDSATCWIEPTEKKLDDALYNLEEQGIEVTEQDFLELFNAWMIQICDSNTALGHTISDDVRYDVRKKWNDYGLEKDWNFSKNIQEIMGWTKESKTCSIWRHVLAKEFLDEGQVNKGKWYVDLSRIKPCLDQKHEWYRCKKCSEITPFMLKEKCPCCGSEQIEEMNEKDYDSLEFWRKPIQSALDGKKIHGIDTEEHTAQLSYKDQRDDLWSKTEHYELRFQDLVQEGETPVDILSSTTTMEVGIDIGSLVAVGLRNIPPMRENYQQRAGRAGRRGASLSTIVTFCGDGPHDTLYFHNPVPMFRGEPRVPWIDIESEKLIQRHLNMIVLQEFLAKKHTSLDSIEAITFLDKLLNECKEYIQLFEVKDKKILIPERVELNYTGFKRELIQKLNELKAKRDAHPELYVSEDSIAFRKVKSLLDALYDEGIIPTYSFPKNVVSTYMCDNKGKIQYEVQRGLDVAIGEYAPGRSIVVDKQLYQIGGLYYPGSERKKGHFLTPARSFVEDKNYMKDILKCKECGWFGLASDEARVCPFCGNDQLVATRQMLKPWGFAPRNGEASVSAQVDEKYSVVQQPLYSTLPESEEMNQILGCENIRMASRTNQRIIMLNTGEANKGFMVCEDCGAAMPGDDESVLKDMSRPYKINVKACRHANVKNVDLGYDFVTDMLVLEFAIDRKEITSERKNNPWLMRAAQSLAEALRLAASKKLDVEFTELVTGYRFRNNEKGAFIDIYIYDSLSSGAGYAVSVAEIINVLLEDMKNMLSQCNCESACYKCLKHYRNQYVHGILDRHAALELLNWGIAGKKAEEISVERQKKLVNSLLGILERMGYTIDFKEDGLEIEKDERRKKLVVYPAMWVEPEKRETIYVSDAYLKYARPYAVRKICDEF